ncbi:site-2 protease family protein [Candidatus Falkowbacteria bacterium]|nr:site-2 protease family protein [Candidatus Falkowbacteria bacterium]
MSLISEPLFFVVWLFAIVVVLTIHEFSHALAATLLGDPTAKAAGRLTLNPLSHISWLGFFMLLLVGFGWGNPVPFNPYNLRFPRFGPAIVALAGPLSNLILAAIFIFSFRWIFPDLHPLFLINAGSANLPAELNLLAIFLSLATFLNLTLAIFNLIPIPPLDGSKILFSVLSDARFFSIKEILERQGSMILIGIIILDNFLNTNIFGRLIFAVIGAVYKLVG